MSKVVEFKTEESIYEQASIWIARLDRELSDEENQELSAWLNANIKHREILFEMAALWDKMDKLSRLSSLFPDPALSEPTAQTHYRKTFALAASLLIATLFGIGGITILTPGSLTDWASTWQTETIDGRYETGIGEHSTVNLPDGSHLVLNTNSLVNVNYREDSRIFFLERGEIHIEVAHEKTRPLSVIVADKVVQAVGTAFNVQLIENNKEVELIVTEGKVLVAKHVSAANLEKSFTPQTLPHNSLSVSKGEKIVLGSKNEEINQIDDTEIQANLSWRQGNIVFRGETLEDALKEISRYTDVQFKIKDPAVKTIRIAGLFKAGDVKGLLTTLKQNFRIDHEISNKNEILLKTNLNSKQG